MEITKSVQDDIGELRKFADGLLPPKYDTDFNLLRWLLGYGNDFNEAKLMLVRHLQFRRFYQIDHLSKLKESAISAYFPLGLLGPTGKDNKLVVIECAGKVDLAGLLKSDCITDFLKHRYKFQETVLEQLNEQERVSGKLSGVIYILDLDGLKLDPSVIQIAAGPYMVVWGHVGFNYPEWISQWVIINAPHFMSLIWRAVSPMIPELTRRKIQILTNKESWQPELLKMIDPSRLPVHWGGTMTDDDGNGMCPSKIRIPETKVPTELYLRPTNKIPHFKQLSSVCIGAGRQLYMNFIVKAGTSTTLELLRYCERPYTMAVYYSRNCDILDTAKMEPWCPEAVYPGLITVDKLTTPTCGTGTYRFKFGNEAAWIRSITLYYRIRFLDNDGAVHSCAETAQMQ